MPSPDPAPPPPGKLLLGCGILRKEIAFLVAKNGWPVETRFLDSSLHVHLGQLSGALTGALSRCCGRDVAVFYGACHPYMDRILDAANSRRTAGQNCIEILLGRERFQSDLASGAFFLLEDWVLRWDAIMRKTFGDNPEIVRDIFRSSHNRLLALRTPCSGDFRAEAEAVGRKLSLPVEWEDAPLEPLERALSEVLFGPEADRG